MTAQPRAAYVHVPFCAHRCGYCDFTVVAGRDDLVGDYLRAVAREMSWLEQPREVDTLYFGGGTPTRLPLAELAELCALAKQWFPLAASGEWTVEANPADLRPETVELLAADGVTRLSLGAQSFNDAKLTRLERDHKAADIATAINRARDAGLAVSIDLIFAAPEETLDQWRHDLDSAIAFDPEHISTYSLTYERGTSFWSRREKGALVESPDDVQRDMYLAAIDALTAAGLEHYEISNFARPGHRSRHNQTYWSGAEYYAVGPGASRYVHGVRETNHRSTFTYIRRAIADGLRPVDESSIVAEREELTPEAKAREALIFGLRRLEGVNHKAFALRFGFQIDQLAPTAVEKFTALGLLADDGQTLRLTREGLLVSDAMWPEFL